jgi:hypothetical protein
MGIWFPSAELAGDEQVRYRSSADTFAGRRSIGGQLTVTDRRVVFVPNRLDGLTGGRGRAVALADIRGVRTLDPGTSAVAKRGLAAAVRPQVEVDDGTGSPLIVTVRDPDELLRLLEHPGARS